VKKLKEQLQKAVRVVATAIPPLDAGGGRGEVRIRLRFKMGGKVVPAARNCLGGFLEALGPHEMVVTVLPAQRGGPGPSVKCFDA